MLEFAIPQFLIDAGAFIAVVAIVVFAHELGHYLVGRICGINAEIFSVGFGPPVISWVDRAGTRWQLASIPLGGFVKFEEGAIIESRGPAARGSEAPSAKHSLKCRAATVAAGPGASFLFAIAVFAISAFATGVLDGRAVVGELNPLPMQANDFEPGDVIVAVNRVEIGSIFDLHRYSQTEDQSKEQIYEVLRGEERLEISGPPPVPSIVADVVPDSSAEKSGLLPGDVVVAIDGEEIRTFTEMRNRVVESNGRMMEFRIWRDGETLDLGLAARLDMRRSADGSGEVVPTIGVMADLFFVPQFYRPTPFEAIWLGTAQTWLIVVRSLEGLALMSVGAISSCNLQGPVGIAALSGEAASQGLSSFVFFIAVLSAAIGFLNLLPIPVLDGGFLLLFGIEAVTGRRPAPQVLNRIFLVGAVAIALLLGFGLWNDFFCP
ncbi:MAG: RIP metalloprotease RseP [Albidovulum sp.]|nr:RIP metalloprotease RseP [Albidovulum sp.]